MKVVITGSSGLVGTALTNSVVRDGHTVVRLLRSGSGSKTGSGESRGETPEKADARSAQPRDIGNIVKVAWNPNKSDLESEPFVEYQGKIRGADAFVNLPTTPLSPLH